MVLHARHTTFPPVAPLSQAPGFARPPPSEPQHLEVLGAVPGLLPEPWPTACAIGLFKTKKTLQAEILKAPKSIKNQNPSRNH